MNDRPTIYIDIDSTIWNFNDPFHAVIRESTGIDVVYDDVDCWDYYFNIGIPAEKIKKCFDIALHPDKVQQRQFFPGVLESLPELYQMGYNIMFLSHNPKPAQLTPAIDMWLFNNLVIPYKLKIFGARNCKIEYMREQGDAWGIVEDKPSTLVKAHKSEFNVLAIKQPWNLKIVEEYGIVSFNDWSEVPKLVEEINLAR